MKSQNPTAQRIFPATRPTNGQARLTTIRPDAYQDPKNVLNGLTQPIASNDEPRPLPPVSAQSMQAPQLMQPMPMNDMEQMPEFPAVKPNPASPWGMADSAEAQAAAMALNPEKRQWNDFFRGLMQNTQQAISSGGQGDSNIVPTAGFNPYTYQPTNYSR